MSSNATTSRIADWIFRRIASKVDPDLILKTNPFAKYDVSETGDGSPRVPRTFDQKSFMNAVKTDAWVYVCTNVAGRSLSAAPLLVQEKTVQDGDLVWETLDTGALVDLIEFPNPQEPMDVIIWKTVMSLLTGDAYLTYDPIFNELWNVQADLVNVDKNEAGEIISYTVTKGAKSTTIDPDLMIHIRMPSPWANYGLPPAVGAKEHILVNYHYIRYLKKFFENGAIPTGGLETDRNLNEQTVKMYRKQWNEMHQGVDRSHTTAILGSGLKWARYSPPLSDLISDTLYKMPRETILAVFGTPPALAGIMEYGNYANVDAQIRMYWENWIKPLMRLVTGHLRIQLVVPHFSDVKSGPGALRLHHDTSEIRALQEDENLAADRRVKYVRGGVMTPNEARKEIELEEIEGGDELLIGIGPMAPPPEEPDEKEPNDDNDELEPDDSLLKIPLGVPRRRSTNDIKRLEKWNRHHKSVLRYQKSFQIVLRRFFDKQLSRLLAQLREMAADGGTLSPTMIISIFLNLKSADDDAKKIFDKKAENEALIKATAPFINRTVERAGKDAVRQVAIDMQFNVNDPNVQAMIAQMHNRIVKVNDATYDEIIALFDEAITDGIGLPEVSKRLRAQYEWIGKVRAKRIAQTEMNGIVNGSTNIGYKQAGVEEKRWLSAFLTTSREHHIAADGDKAGINEKFILQDGDMLAFPGDPEGASWNVINCHCAIEPVT